MYLAAEIDSVADFASAVRWFAVEGFARGPAIGVDPPPAAPDGFADIVGLSDDQLVALFVAKGRVETVGGKIIVPIVDAVLGGRTAGFTPDQLRILGGLKWQVYMLTQESESMKKFYDMTFTTTNDADHRIVLHNLHNRPKAYARRSLILLRTVRAALLTLGASPGFPAPEDMPGPYVCPDCGRSSRTVLMPCGRTPSPAEEAVHP
jgi:hypothetical protein